jgi:hypothetical protein
MLRALGQSRLLALPFRKGEHQISRRQRYWAEYVAPSLEFWMREYAGGQEPDQEHDPLH